MADSKSLTQRLLLLKVEENARVNGVLDTATALTLLESDEPLIRLDTIRMFERLKLPSRLIHDKIISMLKTDGNQIVRVGVVAFIGRSCSLDERRTLLEAHTDGDELVNRIIHTYLPRQS